MANFEDDYNKVLDSFIRISDQYINLSLQVRDGSITADELVKQFDMKMAPIVLALMLLDSLRGNRAILNDPNAMYPKTNPSDIEAEVEKFRRQLDGL